MMMFDDTLISIHAPTRGATILCNHRGLVFGFQSTLPREERHATASGRCAYMNFNPRSHERSDITGVSFMFQMYYFNPRSHERSDMEPAELMLIRYLFQSTLPREERQVPESGTWQTSEISIHAPTRGATSTSNKTISSIIISIHAPTRGATARMRIYQLSF